MDIYRKDTEHIYTSFLNRDSLTEKNSVVDEVLELSEEEFSRYPMAFTHSNYTVKTQTGHAFRNIQIQIHEGTWVMLSKNKAPTIHFVIHHPKMINAFENFAVAVTD